MSIEDFALDDFEDISKDFDILLENAVNEPIRFDPYEAVYNVYFTVFDEREKTLSSAGTDDALYLDAKRFFDKYLSRNMYVTNDGSLIEGSYSKVPTVEISLDMDSNKESLFGLLKVMDGMIKESELEHFPKIVFDDAVTELIVRNLRLYVKSVSDEFLINSDYNFTEI